jgi:hypothetical protein
LYCKIECHLRDAAQPNIRSMTCAWNQMAPDTRVKLSQWNPGDRDIIGRNKNDARTRLET